MTIEAFTKHWKAAPFKPFAIHLADGREFVVRHPDFAGRTPSGRTIMIADAEGFETIDLLLVTSLGPIRNGKQVASKK